MMRFKNIPIVYRITIWFSTLMIIIVSVMMIFMLTMSESMIEYTLLSKLKRIVDYAVDEIDHDDGEVEFDNDVNLFDDGVYLLLYDKNGNLLISDIPDNILPESDFNDTIAVPITINNDKYYIYDRIRTFKKHDEVWLRGLISVSSVNEAVGTFTTLAFTVLPVLLAIAIAGGYHIAKKSFLPIKKIITIVNDIGEGSDLSKRINLGDGNDEIHQLADTFDNMFTRLEISFDKERQFTQDASHELRTPTSVILAQCEYTDEHVESLDEYKEAMAIIKRQTIKMSHLISQLLEFARLENKNTVSFDNVNFSEMLDIICEEQQLLNPDKNLISNIQPNIMITADHSLISRLCINLISNAFTYNRTGGNVYVNMSDSDGDIILSVEDNGIGIADDNLPKIWNRFYRVNKSRTSNAKENLGLGLSMVKWISDLHGGILSVESKLGEGSKFVFKLRKNIL